MDAQYPRVILLVDYSSLLYRAYFSTPDSVPLHGVHGCLNMLARIIQDRKPSGLVLGCDDDWRPEFRVQAIPEYKAHRVSDVPDPVGPHEARGREILHAMGFAVVGYEGYEGEDIIASLLPQCKEPVDILSGDRDLLALVRDPDVRVLFPRRGTSELELFDEARVTEKYSIPGRAYGDFALLRGDPSDGLPGVPGIGEKTAATLIREHGSLAALLACQTLAPKLKLKLEAARDYLAAARKVVLPRGDVPLPAVDMRLPTRLRDPAGVRQFALEYKMDGPLRRLARALGLSELELLLEGIGAASA